MLNLRNFFVASALATCAIALAACGNDYTTSAPTPGPTCSPGTTVQMIYPIPGATGVPDNPQQFVFAVASPLPNTWNAYVNNSSSLNGGAYTIAGMQTIQASQIPSPAATPSFSNPVYQSITLAEGFNSGVTIYVWLNNTNTNCTPAGPLGSFTTK
jgi:hypothetical protein